MLQQYHFENVAWGVIKCNAAVYKDLMLQGLILEFSLLMFVSWTSFLYVKQRRASHVPSTVVIARDTTSTTCTKTVCFTVKWFRKGLGSTGFSKLNQWHESRESPMLLPLSHIVALQCCIPLHFIFDHLLSNKSSRRESDSEKLRLRETECE